MVEALNKELILRKEEAKTPVETVYFGGGTPSVCTIEELSTLLETIHKHYPLAEHIEYTLEANPDDLNPEKIKALYQLGFNRLSIGIQSFFEEDLRLMNRSHNAKQSLQVVEWAQEHITNISIDLIYGIPNSSMNQWAKNVAQAIDLQVPHISSYALTVEDKTALSHWVHHQKVHMPQDEAVHQQFLYLVETLQANDFVHYELSNFGKEGYFSKNNAAYWLGKSYIGIGPSAHSYNGFQRSWNIANNTQYIQALDKNQLPNEIETLTTTDRYNEYIMTGLRTIWGVSIDRIHNQFGKKYSKYLLQNAQKFINNQQITIEQNTLKATLKGKFLIDGIAAELFYLE